MTIEIDLQPGDIVEHAKRGIGRVVTEVDHAGQCRVEGPGFADGTWYSEHNLELIERKSQFKYVELDQIDFEEPKQSDDWQAKVTRWFSARHGVNFGDLVPLVSICGHAGELQVIASTEDDTENYWTLPNPDISLVGLITEIEAS